MKSVTLVVFLFLTHLTNAQTFNSLELDGESLSLRGIGSFYIGGEKQRQNSLELGKFSSDGTISVNQMYVTYMIPQIQSDSISFVLIHGMNLTGKTWETTPDGRMGWFEYLARKGYPVYSVDQVGAGRSGFNQKNYNLVKEGSLPPNTQEAFQRISDDNVWINFRFGLKNGQLVENTKFPIEAVNELSKQSVPFSLFGLPDPNPNYINISKLAVELKHTVLVSHSQSGRFPIEAAFLNSKGIEAMVLLEPGGTASGYTDEQIEQLVNIPLLVLFGDHLENETGISGHSWKNYFDGWSNFVKRLNSAGGKAKIISLPEMNILGNSHMLMQDKNNNEIADLMLQWLGENLE